MHLLPVHPLNPLLITLQSKEMCLHEKDIAKLCTTTWC